MTGLLAALATAAAFLLVGAGGRSPGALRAAPAMVGLAVLALAAAGLLAGLPVPLVVVAAAVAAAGHRAVRRSRARSAQQQRAETVIAVCEGLAADLRSGQPPVAALQAAAADWSEFRPVLDAARLGGDVPTALRELAGAPGASGLRTVAAAWVVAHRSGAGLASAIALAATSMREDRATARVVETELASARATARLLAVLPLGVLLIGRGTGGDPFAFLFGTTPGTVCLACGLAFIWAGLGWLERIARGVHR